MAMRFWITKNGEVPLREQLVRQVVLAILSEDLPAGHKLPSIRALARRYKIHSNTVSAAYHDLLHRGWLELRRGSGLYVRPLQQSEEAAGELDLLLADLLRAARAKGHEPAEVLRRLELLVQPRDYARIIAVESEPGMREILRSELSEALSIPVDAIEPAGLANLQDPSRCLVVALPTRAAAVRKMIPLRTSFLVLRLRSVGGSLEGQPRPAPNALVSIVSGSFDFRHSSREVLIAVGLDPECLCEIDTAMEGWLERAASGALVITDAVAARALPQAKVYRVVADSCIAELKTLCEP
jgi:DNA-binding transcriptional regulator YhcF (GntR family)